MIRVPTTYILTETNIAIEKQAKKKKRPPQEVVNFAYNPGNLLYFFVYPAGQHRYCNTHSQRGFCTPP